MKEKLAPRFRVSYKVAEGKWYGGGEYLELMEARMRAEELSREFEVRIVKMERTIVETYKSKGMKVKSVGVALTSNGPKFVTQYV